MIHLGYFLTLGEFNTDVQAAENHEP